jgi:hypothetical protein
MLSPTRPPARDTAAREMTIYIIAITIASRTYGCSSSICLRIRLTPGRNTHFALPAHTRLPQAETTIRRAVWHRIVTGLDRARIAWAYDSPHLNHITVDIASSAFDVNRSLLYLAPGTATVMPVVPLGPLSFSLPTWSTQIDGIQLLRVRPRPPQNSKS